MIEPATIPLSQLRDFQNTAIPAKATEIDILARTIFGEARREIYQGKVAVGWTIRNRVTMDLWGDRRPDWWGEGLIGCCQKDWQYTCWRDHNRPMMEAATLTDSAFQDCMMAALSVIKGRDSDPTFGATHYYNPEVVREPKWAMGRSPVCVIGHHHFYVGVEPGDPRYTKPGT